MDIDLSLIEVEEMRSVYLKIYKKYSNKARIDSETEDEEICVRFSEPRGFLVAIENRYFHFLQGSWQKNI
jgi:high-affinity nickel permease